MEKILVFGHKNPDTDAICSSLVMADLQTKIRGEEVISCRLGNLNEETKYALNYFKVEEPKLIEKVDEGQRVILVDHNEFTQSVEGIEKAKIEAVVDHHRINNFKTSEPLFYYAQPVGCTSTVLFELYNTNNIKIEQQIAGLMLSAIISDTLLLKSPTTTDKDKKAVAELVNIAGVDLSKYGLDMLKAGTNLDKYTEKELINLDAKTMEKEDVKYIIAQVNTVSIPDVLKRKEKIEAEINKEIEKLKAKAENLMKEYNTLLFDIDGTLLDFKKAENYALHKTFIDHQLELTDEIFEIYETINKKLWKNFELGLIDKNTVVYTRFVKLFEQLKINEDGVAFEDEYQKNLGDGAYLIEYALEILNELYKEYDLYVVTNGVARTQYNRLDLLDLRKYFKKIFISEEIGYQKPKIEFFDFCFKHIKNFDKGKTLIIGDSLSSDMQGGINAKIDTCWYNPDYLKTDMNLNYIIHNLKDLEKILK